MKSKYFLNTLIVLFLTFSLCQAQEFELDNFLGVLAGQQKHLRSCLKGKKETYSRLYVPFGPLKLRENISREGLKGRFKNFGEAYSYTPWHLRDGRAFGAESTSMQGGGFFLTLNELKDHDKNLDGPEYALSSFSKPLESVSEFSIQEIQAQYLAYGIDYLINLYFDCVSRPEDGDLVVYSQESMAKQAGIYRKSKPNWNSPYGGTVESKWGRMSPFVFQHDVFFTPDYYGDVVYFYRLKTQQDAQLSLQKGRITSPSFHNLRPDLYFEFERTTESIKVRDEISEIFGRALVLKMPAIEQIGYINFTGLCYDYAFGIIFRTFSPPSFMPIRPDNHWIEQYFTITTDPKKGDLVCYYGDSLEKPVHYGVYDSPNLVESKWGKEPVHKHPPFYVTYSYGDIIRYYRLNPSALTE